MTKPARNNPELADDMFSQPVYEQSDLKQRRAAKAEARKAKRNSRIVKGVATAVAAGAVLVGGDRLVKGLENEQLPPEGSRDIPAKVKEQRKKIRAGKNFQEALNSENPADGQQGTLTENQEVNIDQEPQLEQSGGGNTDDLTENLTEKPNVDAGGTGAP